VAEPDAGDPTWQDVFVGRQPILDRSFELFGYELLFRSGEENWFAATNPDQASAAVIANSFFVLGIESLVGTARAFINFTRSTLLNDIAFMLPRERVVIEILETVAEDAEVVAACQRLKQAGYVIALDDFNSRSDTDTGAMLDLADIVKIDFAVTSVSDRARYAADLGARGLTLLAEKVEQPVDSEQAIKLGYSYLQGYFFAQPEIRVGRRARAITTHRLQLMQELHQPEPDLRKVEDLFRHDPDLTYKLLRHLNSAAFGLRSRVQTIWRAIALLGERGMRAWTMVVILADLGNEVPSEVIVTSVIRARFCEQIGEAIGLKAQAQELFLMGLFSMIDVITGHEMQDALADLPLADETRAALLGLPNRQRTVLNLARALERSQWTVGDQLLGHLHLRPGQVLPLYRDAVSWGNQSRQIR
jgi:EAL and modified HD-GYP domain-containing signal transduction protein